MPHFISPMIRRRPSAENSRALSSTNTEAVAPSPSLESAQSSIEQSTEPSAIEQQILPDVRISEGGFRQIRDESLVLLSQGISHRIDRSEEEKHNQTYEKTINYCLADFFDVLLWLMWRETFKAI